MKSLTKCDVTPEKSQQPVRWLLRGRTYVALSTMTPGGSGQFDEDRSDSVIDEDTPAQS